jgi:hypothetical protein
MGMSHGALEPGQQSWLSAAGFDASSSSIAIGDDLLTGSAALGVMPAAGSAATDKAINRAKTARAVRIAGNIGLRQESVK